jgi:hypothetical protein
MIIKTDMKENNKANNLREGAIYINANTGTPSRLVNIIPCQGVWLETFDGDGYGEMVKFEDVLYASLDEVQDYLEDHRAYTTSEKAPSHKSFMDGEPCSYSANTLFKSDERQVDVNGDVYVREDEDYLCRD